MNKWVGSGQRAETGGPGCLVNLDENSDLEMNMIPAIDHETLCTQLW